jgi:cytokinesis protein
MPSGTSPVDQKMRQSSSGKGFFGRRLHKEKLTESRNFDEGGLYPEPASSVSSAANSKSSRHSHKPSLDMDSGVDGHGLSMTAGVITAIPYDSLQDSKTPIPVDYLPRNDQILARRDPLPHHLNKGGGDFHQYPSWDPVKSPTNGSFHPTGPRPPPHTSQSNIYSASVRERPNTLVRPGTSTSLTNESNGTLASQHTNESSNTRNSFDQASLYSSVSSATRASSVLSSEASARTAVPSHVTDHHTRPGSSHSGSSHSGFRQSHASHQVWHPQQAPSFNSGTAFTPEGFNLPQPTDERIIEEQFFALMNKRGWQQLPEQARRQMMAYPASKKWTLIHQDKLTEWNSERKRRTTIASADGYGSLGTSFEEGSPEWFVRKVMDDSITAKQLGSLSVSLRTQPMR